jgi:hypothetical protein
MFACIHNNHSLDFANVAVINSKSSPEALKIQNNP